jgi:predicted acyltransferase
MTAPVTVEPAARDLAIDRFRGALVLLMVGGNFLAAVQVVPDFLKHPTDIGFTVADTVAPAFVFVIGLNFGASFARRAQAGIGHAYRHFLVRYLALIGIGAILSAGQTIVDNTPTDWGVLQALGAAGLLCLLVIRLPAWARAVLGGILLVGYQVLLDAWALPYVLGSVQGGLVGALSWGALLILSTAVADAWRAGPRAYGLACLAIVAAAAASVFLVPLSKNRVSLSFVLVTLALSALVFLALELGSRLVPERPGLVCWWGENALVLYLAHLLVLGAMMIPPAGWYASAPLGLAATQLLVILAALSVLAWWLHRRRLMARL